MISTSRSPLLPDHPDLTLCDREPIRTPGSIQPHGFLLALDGEGRVCQVSANLADYVGLPPQQALGQPLEVILGAAATQQLQAEMTREPPVDRPAYYGTVPVAGGRCVDVLAHRHEGLLLLECEVVTRTGAADFRVLYPLISSFLSRLGDAASIEALSELAAQEIRRVTRFGRVLVYRFDEDDHGQVIAESRADDYPSYLHQRFPASDIPRQARALYVANRIRLIPDANYQPAPLLPARHPVTGAANDLSYAALRSVSPVHLQYMRNMGTLASMSISLVIKGKLWGLISCHHATPAFVPFEVRAACEQLGQILALRIESKEDSDESRHRLELRRLLVTMLASLSQGPDLADSMRQVAPELLHFARASGAALVFQDRLVRFGDTPGEAELRALVEWLGANAHGDEFHTHALSQVYPAGAALCRCASGILALPISRIHNHYLIWFRPERIHTIEWAGNPVAKLTRQDTVANPADAPAVPLSPRMSFDTWRETVTGTSERWRASEIDTALEFRTALLGIVLERAEQMAELAEELGRANKELEAFSYSVSHDLRAPLRHIVGFSDLLLEFESNGEPSERRQRFLRNIKESARFAGKLVDDLLSFSHMGRASLRPCTVDMRDLFLACRDKLAPDIGERQVEWEIAALPVVQADPSFLQLAVTNLLANAVKYTQPRAVARIRIVAEETEEETVFHVADNGVGFNMDYVHKLFGVFQRLHRMEDFQGTGIGLANVRRIIERHGGRVWAHGVPDQGATFSFSIPKRQSGDQ